MKIGDWLKSEVGYGRDLADSGLQGARAAADSILHGEPVGEILGRSALESVRSVLCWPMAANQRMQQSSSWELSVESSASLPVSPGKLDSYPQESPAEHCARSEPLATRTGSASTPSTSVDLAVIRERNHQESGAFSSAPPLG